MEILSIGNSFSQDAHRYLHQIAKADGVDIQAFNLFIGGCSLATHHKNMQTGDPAYTLEMNGTSTGFSVSLKDALTNRNWDLVTLQQASPLSPQYDTYQPYLHDLAAYIRQLLPNTKIAMHQTWAYEQGSDRLHKELQYHKHTDMLQDIIHAYAQATQAIRADYSIPCGEVFGALLQNGIPKVHRDTFHADLGLGRYALGLMWYRALTGKEIAENSFREFDVPISHQHIAIAKKCVLEVAQRYGM